jgi:hypothetical protein
MQEFKKDKQIISLQYKKKSWKKLKSKIGIF